MLAIVSANIETQISVLKNIYRRKTENIHQAWYNLYYKNKIQRIEHKMMKKSNFTILLLFLIFIPSAGMYLINYYLFHDLQFLLKDFLSQLAFLPIFYFFSSIIIDTIMAKREKVKIMKNINTLIGVFFSEFGNDFIRFCSKFDLNFEQYLMNFKIDQSWEEINYANAIKFTNKYPFEMDMHSADLPTFKYFLLENRKCLISILENNNLVEHDTFTDLLLAIFHLCEEFKYRDLENLTEDEFEHLSIDIIRAYSLIGVEWLKYSQYVKIEYPHLYSLSISFNPFLNLGKMNGSDKK